MTRDRLDLPVLSPDAARVEHVRARCHAALAHGRANRERSMRRARIVRRALEPALIAGLSVLYLCAVVFDVLRLEGLL